MWCEIMNEYVPYKLRLYALRGKGIAPMQKYFRQAAIIYVDYLECYNKKRDLPILTSSPAPTHTVAGRAHYPSCSSSHMILGVHAFSW